MSTKRWSSVNRTDNHIIAAVAALGMTSIATQILLVREFVSVFEGNELVIGVVLAAWMVLTGAGSFLGRFSLPLARTRAPLTTALLALSLLPALAVFLLRYLRNIVFTPGSMIGLAQALYGSALILSPYCLLSGFLFVFAASLSSGRPEENSIGALYAWESLGSAAGGALFGVVLASELETFQTLFLLMLGDACVAFLVARREGWGKAAALTLAAAACAMAIFWNADLLTRGFLFPGQEIVEFGDTPYGSLTVTRQGDQLNFFENSTLMFSTNDVVTNEEIVHYAMAQVDSPRRVLLISGGISGTAREILKYGVDMVDYVELDPRVISMGRKYTRALDDPRIRVINDDARIFVRNAAGPYDAALIALPDPATARVNRFYTLEFFRDLKRTLSDSAVVSIGLLPAADYQGAEARRVSSVLARTLRQTFARVLIVPGQRNYFLASDAVLDIRIAGLIGRRGISTTYVNGWYLDDRDLAERSAGLAAALDSASTLNTDFQPVCYYRQMEYWLSYFTVDPLPWIALAAAGSMFLLARSSAVGAGIFAGGAAASALEIVLLLSYQVMYGSLYQMTGVVIAAFMAGLAAGSSLARSTFRGSEFNGFILVQLALGASGFLLPPLLLRVRESGLASMQIHVLFTASAFAVACLVGMEFALASRVRQGRAAVVASELYGLDLAGSALGALLASVYAIPLLGMLQTSRAAGVVSAAGGVLCVAARQLKRSS